MTVAVYWVIKTVLGPVLKSLYRPWVRGAEHVPSTGGAILASNHLSFVDSIFLPLVLKRRVTFLAKMEYFTGTGLSGRAKALFFRGVGQVPVDRSGGQASEEAIESGLRILRRGELLGLYPEGTRSPDARLYRGKTGVARMALESRCPVIPVAMIGTDKVQPAGRTMWSIRRVGIIIGRPLDFSRYEDMADDRHVTRSVTDEIMYELMRLSGQEYVDEYASVVKERLAEEKLQRVVGDVLDTVTRITGRDTSRLSERLFGDDLAPGDYTATAGLDDDDEDDRRASPLERYRADRPRDEEGPGEGEETASGSRPPGRRRREDEPLPEPVPDDERVPDEEREADDEAGTAGRGRAGAAARRSPSSRLDEAMDAGEVAITAGAVVDVGADLASGDGSGQAEAAGDAPGEAGAPGSGGEGGGEG